MKTFIYDDYQYDKNRDWIATVGYIEGKNQLLNELCKKLKFPDYFGFNWDALNDCLNDFIWFKENRIVLIHSAFPILSSKDTQIYLEILFDAINSWTENDDHLFDVVFPEQDQDMIESIVKKILMK